MTAPVFDLTAATDALYRSDNGIKAKPGDAQLIAAYDRHLNAAYDRHLRSVEAAEYATWLAQQCAYCGPEGATGPDCGDCDGPAVAA